ncbi:MAG: response regulator [Pararhizobium sp.]
MGALMRAHAWDETPFGPPEDWPQSLRSALSICLGTNFPIAIYWGPELALLYNDAWSPIPGEKHPWALGRPGREMWPEILDTIGPLYLKVQATGEGVRQKDQLLPMHRHGYTEECYFNFTFSPIRGEGGRVEGIFNAVVETTFRVIGERRERTLRELAEGIATARSEEEVFAVAADLFAKRSTDVPFCLLYRHDHEANTAHLIGRAGIESGAPASPEQVDMADPAAAWPFARVVETGGAEVVSDLARRFEAPLPGGPWPQPATQALVVPIGTSVQSGAVAAFLVAGVSPRRALDADYRAFVERAAAHIAGAIGHARAYEEERQRAEALAEIDRAKTTFFSNVSHEFRTPLTLMLGPLEESLASADRLEPDERERVYVVHRNGLRLLKLVNSLLDFSRIEAGRAQASYEPTDLSAFTADLASNFRSATEKAGLSLVVEGETLPQPVYVDRDMWEKIVLNLLSNAFKFTFEGGIHVEVRASETAAELIVRDTGTGIPEHELPRLFERFHRVEGARGRSFEGSGIGLALVQELVRLHGGRIGVTSEEGRGTTFTVSIPFGSDHLPKDRLRTERPLASTAVQAEAYVDEAIRWLPDAVVSGDTIPSPAAERPAPAPGERPHVLLADDNADMRDYVRRLLGGTHEVEAVEDGIAALEAVRRRRPDLVLTDVMMPRLDGFGLIRAVREDTDLLDLPIIVLSARAGEEASAEGLDAGADDYLVKPFSARELVTRVDAALAMARVRREMGEAVREEARTLEMLNRVGSTIAAELDLGRAVQMVTDAATELTGAAFGSFFYNVLDDRGESYMLYTLSGAPREAFEKFPMPRNTAVFGPTFRGEGIVRSEDITKDPRYGQNHPRRGMPEGHLPVCSYLAAPVISRSGEVLGGLFFGHPEPGVFTERAERILIGIAAQASIAIDNARLYQAAQSEIAERRRTEAALRESEERLSVLNETLEAKVAERTQERDRTWNLSRDMLAVADMRGIVRSVNPAWTATLGWSEADIVGRTSEWMEHPDDRLKTQAELARLAAGASTLQLENRLRAKDGSYRWLSWTAVPEGDLIYAMARDVTAAKEQAETLRLAEEQLRQAQKMEAVGKLTGGVAHDFNNLLQVIGGNLQLLSKDIAGHEKAEQRLRNALAGVTRGSKLASQLLAFGRRQPLAPKVVNLGRFIRGIDDMLRRALGDGIEIETVVSGGLWNTFVDPSQVENALLNLAINARDAMQGHGKLTIEAGNAALDDAYALRHPDVAPGQYVMLAVTDTGSGMSPEVIEHAFEPFFTTKPEGQGTGLGLSMVWGLVKQSDGHIKIYSEPGDGTTIRIYLPRSRQEEDLAIEIDAGPVVGGTETVLVVEDDEDVRNTVIEMLADFGYRVLKAKDAQSALAIIESGVPIDLLFTDVVMPGPLRSPELARKARERLPDIAVLFTSGYTDNAIVHGGRLDDGIELLSKPYTREALARKLRHVLGDRPQVTPARPSASPLPDAAGAGAPRPLRILVVEDESLILMSTADMLTAMGHTVIEATNGAEALALLDEQPVDVLLTDHGLPGMSGAELAVASRRRQPRLKIVFASGADTNPDVAAGEQIADAILLRKPYDERGLAEALKSAVA